MPASTWNLDPAHTDVIFAVKHLMVTTVRGKFTEVAGSVAWDPAAPATVTGSFTARAGSLDTGVADRDGHLRSADFFDVERFPELRFVPTAIAAKGGSDYEVTGNLTIRDVTRPVTFEVEFLGLYASMQGARRAGFHATARLDREAFGLTWNVALESGGWLVGKEVRIEIDLALEEAAA